MRHNLAQKLIASHLVEGDLVPGASVGLRFDQTLCQDATGTLVMLTLEAMNLDKAKTKVSAQYVDHNLIQEDHKNPDDHLFLQSAAERFGVWFSRPGNGISHPLHMQRFGVPGDTLIGSDSHTCAAGSLGMLAMGAGGADVAMAMAGEPVFIKMPEVWGVKLSGELPDWVSAKDVILEMLRRHDVDGGVGKIIEYYGPGLACLSAMDRHVIANMGAELGATATVFPSDDEIKRFLESEGRGEDWQPLQADLGCDYDHHDEIDLSTLVPLIAKPSSPGNVVPVSEVAGEPIYQAYIGSSANPGYRDFAVAAEIVKGEVVSDQVSFDINPSSRQLLQMLARDHHLESLIAAGARLHQAGCNGCIGMGQAPATEKNSLRTTPRNFPGRSGTKEDRVWLCSPETAAASALTGVITDPRTLSKTYPRISAPEKADVDMRLFNAPSKDLIHKELIKGPNIASLPELEPLAENIEAPVLLSLEDNISTDEILPAGAEVLPFRSNIPRIAEYAFSAVAEDYPERARNVRDTGGHIIVAGKNYGQGSSREHAALAPRYLGLRAVIAVSFARIHWQNLINFGILPLTFENASDRKKVKVGDVIQLKNVGDGLVKGQTIKAVLKNSGEEIPLCHQVSDRQLEILTAGGIIPWVQARNNH